MITDHQRRIVFGLCRELGWDDDMRHAMLDQWVGKSSLAANAEHPISQTEAATILRYLHTAVRQVQSGRAAAKRRRRRIWPGTSPTPEQLHAIAKLRAEVFGANDTAWRGRLQTLKLPVSEQWFTPAHAARCITDLSRLHRAGWHPTPVSSPRAN